MKIAAFFVGNKTPIYSLEAAKKVSLEYGGDVTNEEGEWYPKNQKTSQFGLVGSVEPVIVPVLIHHAGVVGI